MLFTTLVVFCSLTLFALGSYLVWPSRWNVWGHFQLAFVMTAYGIPLYALHQLEYYPLGLVESYATMLGIGGLTYLIGLLVGSQVRIGLFRPPDLSAHGGGTATRDRIASLVAVTMSFACIGICVCFLGQGYIPMFTADPFMAKFYRGIYQEGYLRVRLLYKPSLATLQVLLPLALILWWETRSRALFIVSVAAPVLLAMTMQRSAFAFGIVLFLGWLAARKTTTFVAFIFVVMLILPLGSAANFLFLSLIGKLALGAGPGTILEVISSGAPDIKDDFTFLASFLTYGEFTSGRTFLGGLVPGRYHWNPQIWSAMVAYGAAHPDDLITGGLRLPAPLWGYSAFGWPGIPIVCLLSGIVHGAAARAARIYAEAGDNLAKGIALLWFIYVGGFFTRYYVVAYTDIINTAIILFALSPCWMRSQAAGPVAPLSFAPPTNFVRDRP